MAVAAPRIHSTALWLCASFGVRLRQNCLDLLQTTDVSVSLRNCFRTLGTIANPHVGLWPRDQHCRSCRPTAPRLFRRRRDRESSCQHEMLRMEIENHSCHIARSFNIVVICQETFGAKHCLLRQWAAVGLGGEPDEYEADEIDQAHRGAGERIAAVQLESEKTRVGWELRHQIAGLQDADGR
jgi:hypothetical protein